ncbi:serine/threonine protein phosphatase [Anoxybacter fermentans]|uniref:Serine/threonine protein phosphatase n=2 Tax=Anoxybacter fermentans TaxID=1323375 RepID=A0A3S9T307_9FIRM|nr:serine/threonine protein phosphatase [Anoxybacter fermentans]
MSRYGEELCGDHVEVLKKEDGTILVLSDGLGSGVKANILATLTTKIAIGLIEKNLPLEEIIETIIETLPICEVREIAYSTLAVLKIYNDGRAYLIELDSPPAFFLKQGKVQPLYMKERRIKGKLIKEAHFKLELGDYIFLTSDGIIHAGIGGLMDFGLGWDGVANHLEELAAEGLSLNRMVEKMIKICEAYYLMEPGDDFTIIGARLRKPRYLTIMTGPPINPSDDFIMSRRLLEARGKKVICGGTTAQIFARETGCELECTFNYVDPDVPPISFIEGVDLVTEGLLTLNRTLEYLQRPGDSEMPLGKDGASLLARELLESDEIHFLVGRAVNEAHQNLDLPVNLGIRTQVIKRLVNTLKGLNKKVKIEWF